MSILGTDGPPIGGPMSPWAIHARPATATPNVVSTDPDWQPGDPLYQRRGAGNPLYNFRDDPDTEACCCTDAASWPNPCSFKIQPGDEIGDLITAVRHDAIHAYVREALHARLPWLRPITEEAA